jgi:electron transfer flavoprotein alpha subunit
MKILALVKQIPDVNRIELDKTTMRIRREGVPLIANPFDLRAVEQALILKEKYGAEVVAASMGPPSARAVLENALKMGCDEAYLITDRAYAGSDTLITSKVLSAFARKLNAELILAGRYSLDGETGQVPAEIAALLGWSYISSISNLHLDGEIAAVEQDHEAGSVSFEVPLPAVFSVSEKINRPRPPSLNVDTSKIVEVGECWIMSGVSGSDSPTVVEGITQLESRRNVKFLEPSIDTYRFILTLLHGEIKKEPFSLANTEFRGEIWGIAVGSREVAEEISSKIGELANAFHLRAVMAGNIEPERLKSIHCNEFILLETSETDAFAAELISLIKERRPDYVIFPSNTEGREISGAVAASLSLGLTADCVDVDIEDGKLVQYKPAFGGGMVARIISKTRPQMATARPGMFKSRPGYEIGMIQRRKVPPARIRRVSFTPVPSEFRPLQHASTVIGVGRGVRKKEELQPIIELAGILGAAVGGTRPIVDYGFLPRQQQIGLTGSAISPQLYIALGISGQDNHVVGIRYARTVLAVNTKKDAPIFKYSDYGVVMDLFEFVNGLKKAALQLRAS